MSERLLSVAEVASVLAVHRTRINQLIDTGTLPATRIGRAYVIREADLETVKERPAPGRPKTPAAEAETKESETKTAGKKAKPGTATKSKTKTTAARKGALATEPKPSRKPAVKQGR